MNPMQNVILSLSIGMIYGLTPSNGWKGFLSFGVGMMIGVFFQVKK